MKQTLRDSAALRWSALLLLALAMFCAYIFMDILSPIKDLMQSQRGWDSDAFGTMQGSETFLNVFVFFLIFAGIILDKMGVRFTALLSGAVMLVGACINGTPSATASSAAVPRHGSQRTLTTYPCSSSWACRPSMRACLHRQSSQPWAS